MTTSIVLVIYHKLANHAEYWLAKFGWWRMHVEVSQLREPKHSK